jgi:hypothetical protein
MKTKKSRDLYRGINEFRKGCHRRINFIKNENGNLFADPHSVLNRLKNVFKQVLTVRGVHDVRQMDIHTAEPLMPEPSVVEVEIATGKMKSEILRSEIHKLICSIWNNEELPQQWKESIIVPIYKKGDMTDCNNYRPISLLSTFYKILSNILLARLTPYVSEVIGGHQCRFRLNRSTINFRKACDSLKREVLYSILLEFCMPKKLVRLIKMC